MPTKLHPETQAIHVGIPDLGGARPLNTPLYQTANFGYDNPEDLAEAINSPASFAYLRNSNPTVRALEDAVSALEGAAASLATSSGMGAIHTVLHTLLGSGDHIIVQKHLYGGTFALLRDLSARYGVDVTYIDGRDAAEVTEALRPTTKVLYLETLSNPTAQVTDLPAFFAAGRAAGLTGVVDNTFASPIGCRPISLGADVVVHSSTKFLSGHGDVLGGIASFADAALHRRVWSHSLETGTIADPFAAWLTLRGLATLGLRMRRHHENADGLATFLSGHPRIAKVHWPGLPDHPGHELARRLLPHGYGGVFAIDVDGGRKETIEFTRRLRVADRAVSLGGFKTLVQQPSATSHRSMDAEGLRAIGITEGTVRIAVGLEHLDDLTADFAQALD
ncbi:PLP-dependent aspartate aminotransferase family protein [Streptomyces sp. WAC08241]|uniref:trans-sulfuration enzyme family protein n=1 Tax=Streptomyces sp. WAC08241 TaxID=2487421 RepID=UPI000F7A8A5C|nr:aminotransferase class I/II-fold pyridoxal phosphate-dependent enzyme [Streptomyces sp. WAC08241]RSS46019.1 aminotransferase class I/II-fold pyridoxal phosphate-dependent enzyme [Streptomyces sp. WAC08241]